MTVYPDTSVLLAAVIDDDLTEIARLWLASRPPLCLTSWTAAEFSSGVRRKLRNDELDDDQAEAAERLFGRLVQGRALERVNNDDLIEARRLVRGSANLRAADALHISVADRLGLPLVTLDKAQKAAAATIGLEVVDL